MKWCFICAMGVCLLAAAVIRIYREDYKIVIVLLFTGVFLVYTSFKKFHLLSKAYRVLKEGKPEITVYYRDKNLVESKNTVIPAWADSFYFYGFLPEKNKVKTYRWEGIWQIVENGKELDKEDILKRFPDQ